VLIVDIMRLSAQTIESLNILKRFKTPFVVAANKMDRIGGWHPVPNAPFAASMRHRMRG